MARVLWRACCGVCVRKRSHAPVCSLSDTALCNNGVRNGSEACDDGNGDSGDGCSSTCTVESGWLCSGGNASAPDVCVNGSAAERAALRELCVANSGWCATNKWTGDTDDFCADSLSEDGTSNCASGGSGCANGWTGVGCNSAGRVTRM